MVKSKDYMARYRVAKGLPKSAGTPPEDMTDSQLANEIDSRRRRIGEMGDRLVELAQRIDEARMSPREGRRERVDGAQRRHNEAKETYDRLRDELAALEDERAHRRQANERPANRTFVNSYGEATTRYITSQSYESAQRRLNREMESRMRW